MRDDSPIDASAAFARGILLFWAAWVSVVFASNLCDALREAGALSGGWWFASGNLSMIREATSVSPYLEPLAPFLFAAVVLTQLAAALLFWRAFADRQAAVTRGHPKVLQAFAVATALFAGFLVADELLIVYDRLTGLETTHLLLFCALLLSLLAISTLAGE